MSVTLEAKPQEENMSQFLREIREYPRLGPEEERDLARRCEAGDEEAIRHMVVSNLPLVVSVAREYRGRGTPMLDLIQEGSIGLLEAAHRFDHTRQVRFSTYATKWIRKGILGFLEEHGGPIRVPAFTAQKMRSVATARKALLLELNEEPTALQIAEKCGLTEEKVQELQSLMPEVYSLDFQTGETEGLYSVLEDEQAAQPYAGMVRQELETIMHALLEQLEQRQRRILTLHYGMEDGTCHSLEEIGRELGISKERVRQIEHQAIAKLQKSGERFGLEDFLNE